MATTIHTFVTLLYTFVRDILSLLFCYGRPLETLWSGGGELLSHKDFFFCYQCAVMKIFLQNVVHEYLLSLIKKKNHSWQCKNIFLDYWALMKFFTQFSFAWIISLYRKNCWLAAQWDTKYTLWVYEPPTAAYQMIQDGAGIRMIQSPYHAREQWLSILIFFATERHCSRAWYGDWIILRFSVNHNIYICGIFLPCHFERQEPMKGNL